MFGFFICMIFVTIFGAVWSYMLVGQTSHKPKYTWLVIAGTIICLALSVVLAQTAQTKMYWTKFIAGGQKGTWIVIDNSGGETIRHWVLFDNYVKGCDQTDGWEFIAEDCAPCYVGGDSFAGKISPELARGNYKEVFNIPENQKTLH